MSRPGIASAPARGFTLLELLVAMFIAAIIFAMGYGAINQALKSREGLQEQQAKLLQLQTAMRVIEQDLVQLAPRPIREPLGTGYQPALVASTSTQPLLALTRGGWSNPAGLQRPGLQRVAYYFENGTLRREYWSVLDPTQASTAFKRDLMTKLKSVSLRFISINGGQWQTEWPPLSNTGIANPSTSAPASQQRQRPIAVEVTLETEEWGKLVRIFEVAG